MKIWKYKMPITSEWIKFEIPGGGQIVHVEMQGQELCFWVLVEPHRPYTVRQFAVFGTGHEIPPKSIHRGSCLMLGGALVWHLMEKP